MPDQQGHALLESDLRALGRELDTELGAVDLTETVTRALRARSAPAQPHRQARRRRLTVALVASLVIAATAAVPSARAAVTNFLDIGVVRIHHQEPPRPVAPTATLNLGEPITLAGARVRVPVVLPRRDGLRNPDEVWFTNTGGGGVSLVYRARRGLPPAHHTGVGLLVQEFAGESQANVNKYLSTGARARQVTVGSGQGVFVSGGDHFVFYEDASGADVYEAGRLAGNALIVQRGPLTIRLEADLPLERMVAIAGSLD
jgi:hypothetical protein